MKFLMLVCVESASAEPSTEPVGDVEEWVTEMDGSGVRLAGAPTAPADEATVVRVRQGTVVTSDGPFLESKEVLAGFDLLECRDLQHAIEVAAAHPFAVRGVMELRALLD